jgi:hypothetical protein
MWFLHAATQRTVDYGTEPYWAELHLHVWVDRGNKGRQLISRELCLDEPCKRSRSTAVFSAPKCNRTSILSDVRPTECIGKGQGLAPSTDR